MSSQKRIAVIGAGSSGLSAIKACKEENVNVLCYEKSGDACGLWRYREDDVDGIASVMKSTIMNTSKEVSAYSDFPPPKEFPNYMHNSLTYEYFMMYAHRFDLIRHIRYHMEVIKIEKADDYNITGRWFVVAKNSRTGETEEEIFDGVMICIGHHTFPKIPNFPGQEKFKGEILHTHSLKKCDQFSGKNVVVVGIGNSGVDAAVDSSYFARRVYLSSRRGSWIFSRVGKSGLPIDFYSVNRKNDLFNSFLPFNYICDHTEKELNERFNHEFYNLKPKHRVLEAHPTINDALPNCIISGKIQTKHDISKFEEDGIVFVGDKHPTEIDVVIFATGYETKFPFLKENINCEDNKIELYKFAIPAYLKHKTLAFIGNIDPVGPSFPLAEMQSRWFMQIFKGTLKLPSQALMEKDIQKVNAANTKRYVNSTRHTIEADYLPYMDDLAEQIGAKPNFLKMVITDPKLFKACIFDPAFPYQYRLTGPHKWKGARDAILNYEERVKTPLNSEKFSLNSLEDNCFKDHLLLRMVYKVFIYIIIIIMIILRMLF